MFSSIFDKCIMLQDKQNIHEKGEWLRKGLKMFGMLVLCIMKIRDNVLS
jgi:hypothetical protein